MRKSSGLYCACYTRQLNNTDMENSFGTMTMLDIISPFEDRLIEHYD